MFCSGCVRIVDEPPAISGRLNEVCDGCEHAFVQCVDCNEPVHESQYVIIEDGDYICHHCNEDRLPVCTDCEHAIAGYVREHDGDSYCRDCYSENFSTCDHCNDTEYRRDLAQYPNIELCDYCDDRYFTCVDCEDRIHENYMNENFAGNLVCDDCDRSRYEDDDYYEDGQCDCADCRESRGDGYESPSGGRRDVESEILGGTPRYNTQTMGAELEVKFDGGVPFYLGGYGSGSPAREPFFSGWRAERDCTVDAEFPSPILSGSAGLAEMIETAKLLTANGATVDSDCGQHVTVSVPNANSRTPVNVQRLTYAVEDAMYALTGAYRRMHSDYAPRMKNCPYGTSDLKSKYRFSERQISVNIRDNELAEFRYPPGTLNSEQMAINVGIAQLVAQLAGGLFSESEIDDMFDEAIDIEENPDLSHDEKIHEHVKHGITILAHMGWSVDGEMPGLPYDPRDPVSVKLEDFSHPKTTYTRLPECNEILARMQRQLHTFYSKTSLGNDELNETLEIMGLPAHVSIA